ncbi:MAG TPA: hypothetical protein VF062_01955 [Candidatus Limnocylindrales bacterium]
MPELMPEPPDKSWVVVGPDGQERAYVRDDRGLRRDDEMRWWLVDGTAQDAGYRWSEVAAYGNVTRLFRQSEVDEAVRDGGYEQIGEHRIALGAGRCVVHGERYEPHELDVLRRREGGRS